MTSPLIDPNNDKYPWHEHHYQEHIVGWLRDQKSLGRLSFDIGMEGVRLPPGLRIKMKNQGMDAGVPDIKLKLKGGKLVHIELKRYKGRLSDAQMSEIDLLMSLGHPCYVVKRKTPEKALNAVKEIIRIEEKK